MHTFRFASFVLAVGVFAALVPASPAVAATHYCGYLPATIVGTPGPDRLRGTPGPDRIVGLGGRDRIDGGGGHDAICGNGGNDLLLGGPGVDLIDGGPGADELLGQRGADSLWGGAGHDKIVGDRSRPGTRQSADNITGGPGRDVMIGGAGDDTLRGGGGVDTYRPGSGRNTATFYGENGVHVDLRSNIAVTPSGREALPNIVNVGGSRGDDVLLGGGGDNEFSSLDESGKDVIRGRNGNDRIEVRIKGDIHNVLHGGGGNDVILFDLHGSHTWPRTSAAGASGKDTFKFLTSSAMTIDMPAGTARSSKSLIRFSGGEVIYGGYGTNQIIGSDGADILHGSHGGDTIDGGGGNDRLYGYRGDDTLLGGAGYDVCYDTPNTNAVCEAHRPPQ